MNFQATIFGLYTSNGLPAFDPLIYHGDFESEKSARIAAAVEVEDAAHYHNRCYAAIVFVKPTNELLVLRPTELRLAAASIPDAALEPFRTALTMIETRPLTAEGTPLRNLLPDTWPTLKDLRSLVKRASPVSPQIP